ncbi:hypothetical protein [Bacillus alkalicellulosilyticus]|uniref:hypothetical protein n=1 Tax=Alkalihalobacterium alkalicellulosilyticum TaxID=1912214 RepID=UPI000997EE77|nr:hypothetical protein [Bacillus alkalicellulosilyticus]
MIKTAPLVIVIVILYISAISNIANGLYTLSQSGIGSLGLLMSLLQIGLGSVLLIATTGYPFSKSKFGFVILVVLIFEIILIISSVFIYNYLHGANELLSVVLTSMINIVIKLILLLFIQNNRNVT